MEIKILDMFKMFAHKNKQYVSKNKSQILEKIYM